MKLKKIIRVNSAFQLPGATYRMGKSAAVVNRETGECYVNTDIYDKLTSDQKRFLLLHEEGHYVLQTVNEFEADRYAFNQYIQDKPARSLRALIYAHAWLLDKGNLEHQQRYQALYDMCLAYDKKTNMSSRYSGYRTALLDDATITREVTDGSTIPAVMQDIAPAPPRVGTLEVPEYTPPPSPVDEQIFEVGPGKPPPKPVKPLPADVIPFMPTVDGPALPALSKDKEKNYLLWAVVIIAVLLSLK